MSSLKQINKSTLHGKEVKFFDCYYFDLGKKIFPDFRILLPVEQPLLYYTVQRDLMYYI